MEKKIVTSSGVNIYTYANNSLHSFYISLFVKGGMEGDAGYLFEMLAEIAFAISAPCGNVSHRYRLAVVVSDAFHCGLDPID